MKKAEIKRMMVVFSDNDFVRAWDWIGEVSLMTLRFKNFCEENVLEDSQDIETFIHSLLPLAIEYIQYRRGPKEREDPGYSRYRNIEKEEVRRLTEHFKRIRFIYNFDETDLEWGGSEALVIDLENNKSYLW